MSGLMSKPGQIALRRLQNPGRLGGMARQPQNLMDLGAELVPELDGSAAGHLLIRSSWQQGR